MFVGLAVVLVLEGVVVLVVVGAVVVVVGAVAVVVGAIVVVAVVVKAVVVVVVFPGVVVLKIGLVAVFAHKVSIDEALHNMSNSRACLAKTDSGSFQSLPTMRGERDDVTGFLLERTWAFSEEQKEEACSKTSVSYPSKFVFVAIILGVFIFFLFICFLKPLSKKKRHFFLRKKLSKMTFFFQGLYVEPLLLQSNKTESLLFATTTSIMYCIWTFLGL